MDGDEVQAEHATEAKILADLETLARSLFRIHRYADPDPGTLMRIVDALVQSVSPAELITDGRVSYLAARRLAELVMATLVDQD